MILMGNELMLMMTLITELRGVLTWMEVPVRVGMRVALPHPLPCRMQSFAGRNARKIMAEVVAAAAAVAANVVEDGVIAAGPLMAPRVPVPFEAVATAAGDGDEGEELGDGSGDGVGGGRDGHEGKGWVGWCAASQRADKM
jgi:hypothetical protein